ncbi:hypothetical protein ABT324_29715 [Saccharopolyspora sp. NPDC000359]|uniref:hypothetical protein n=1 Tax=Saccharopolyspora sp. NPDC000359 TaxID=3154251 RepID=UPI00331EFCDC
MTALETAVHLLAQAPPPPGDPGGQGEDFGKSSPVGLVLLILFAVAVVFLIRSMTKHLRKLPVVFDEEKAASAAPARVKRAEAESAKAAAEAEPVEEDAKPDKGGSS